MEPPSPASLPTDGTGHVIGAWVTDRPASGDSGVLPYIYVDSVDDPLGRVTDSGGEVVRAPYPEGGQAGPAASKRPKACTSGLP
jgi:predicted enzyme related to lactoylglutathione lyase